MQIHDVRQQFAIFAAPKSEESDLRISSAQSQLVSGKDAITVEGQSATKTKTIDMRNISINEYNELVRAGVTKLPVPMLLPPGSSLFNNDIHQVTDTKIDYLAQVEKSLAFNLSIGDHVNIAFLQNRLAEIRQLHGLQVELPIISDGLYETV